MILLFESKEGDWLIDMLIIYLFIESPCKLQLSGKMCCLLIGLSLISFLEFQKMPFFFLDNQKN